jgi:predicted transcriptional regulator
MKIKTIVELLQARVICGTRQLESEVINGFASDLMSDVLTLDTDYLVLLTGLSNLQVIRTAEMADIFCIVIVRGKKVTKEMHQLADENGIVLIETPFSMFRAISVLHDGGLNAVY